MLRGLFEGWHPILLILVVVLIFGANRLPGAARNIAQSMKIFKRELESGDDKAAGPASGSSSASTAAPVAPTAPVPPTPPVATTAPPAAPSDATPPPAAPDAPPAAGGTAARA